MNALRSAVVWWSCFAVVPVVAGWLEASALLTDPPNSAASVLPRFTIGLTLLMSWVVFLGLAWRATDRWWTEPPPYTPLSDADRAELARKPPQREEADIALSRLAQQIVARLEGMQPSTVDRLGDAFKDLLLHAEIAAEDDDPVTVEPLPRMPVDEFVQAMHFRVDEMLHEVAGAINEAPTGNIVAGCEDRVCKLLAVLWTDALELGINMRLQAADGPVSRRRGDWAHKLRQMKAGGSALPLRPAVSAHGPNCS